jgi:hypothetical protein
VDKMDLSAFSLWVRRGVSPVLCTASMYFAEVPNTVMPSASA